MVRNRCFSCTFCLAPSNVCLFFNFVSSVEIGSGNAQENTFMASDGVVRRVDEPSRPAGRDSPVPVDFRLQMDIHDKGQGAERQGARGSTQGNHASGAFPARAVQGPLGSPNRGLVAIRCKEAARGGHNRRAVLLPRPAPCLYRTPLPSLHDVYQVEKALGHANFAVTEAYLRSIGMS